MSLDMLWEGDHVKVYRASGEYDGEFVGYTQSNHIVFVVYDELGRPKPYVASMSGLIDGELGGVIKAGDKIGGGGSW